MPAKAVPADTRRRQPVRAVARRIAQFLPSRRSLAVGAGVLAVAAGGYVIARETSIFAIDQIEVTGGSPGVNAQVSHALAPFVGRSLVGLDGGAVIARADGLSSVISASYDRSFPSTLHVTIVPEHPIAVLRAGPAAWLVSARGRVIRPIATTGEHRLPRIWHAEKKVRVGEVLPAQLGGSLFRVVAAAGSFRSRIETVAVTDGMLVFHLRSGVVLVLGTPYDIALKVAVAEKILRKVPAGTRTVDVSVPSRVVTSTT